jgi:hypothetical protein
MCVRVFILLESQLGAYPHDVLQPDKTGLNGVHKTLTDDHAAAAGFPFLCLVKVLLGGGAVLFSDLEDYLRVNTRDL